MLFNEPVKCLLAGPPARAPLLSKLRTPALLKLRTPAPARRLLPARSPGGSCADVLPLVFLHGVGAGLLPYLTILFNLAGLGLPMVVPERWVAAAQCVSRLHRLHACMRACSARTRHAIAALPDRAAPRLPATRTSLCSKHVSMRLVSWLPTVDDMADAAADMLSAHGLERAVVAAHSYGTMVASRWVCLLLLGSAPLCWQLGCTLRCHKTQRDATRRSHPAACCSLLPLQLALSCAGRASFFPARLVLKHEARVHTLALFDPVCFAM